MKLISNLALAAIALTLAACAPSASQLKKVMAEHPDILHEAIKADPVGFFDVIKEVQGKAQEQSQAQQMEKEYTRVLESIKAPKLVPSMDESRALVGPSTAKVTIVEWYDFKCGYCAKAHETVKQILQTYPDTVRVAYKHMPILSPESKTAAQYMEAISMQDKAKALEFHDKVLQAQGEFREGGEKFLDKIVKEVGADLAKVKKDAKSDTVSKRLASDVEEAQKYEFGGTPGFALNGADIHGAYPFEFFKKVIDNVTATK